MSSTRCGQCHASISVPAELDAMVMRCSYCGLDQPVPDGEARRRLLLEERREARIGAEREAERAREAEREAREEAKGKRDRKEAGRRRLFGWLGTLITMLVAPTIIAITVFDAPARLGCGASGSDRLEQMQAQLATDGCRVLSAIGSEYASSNVSQLIKVGPPQCVRVLAAGGDGHSTLGLRLFSSAGKEVAKAADTTDPQLTWCTTGNETLRYEIEIGPASKGRLSHMALGCPPPRAKPTPVPARPKPAPARPRPAPTRPKPR